MVRERLQEMSPGPLLRALAWFLCLGIATSLAVLAGGDGDSLTGDDDSDVLVGAGSNPAVASDASGNTVVVWEGADGDEEGVKSVLFDAQGQVLRPEFQVNVTTAGSQAEPDVVYLSTGEFVVVWQSDDRAAARIQGRVLSAAGDFLASEFQINEDATSASRLPAVGADQLGNFVVAWTGAVDSAYAHFARPFAGASMPIGFELQFGPVSSLTAPAIAVEPTGDHLVVWEDNFADVRGRVFDLASMPIGFEFQVNATATGAQSEPAAAINGDGTVTVVWQSADQDSSGSGIFGRRVQTFSSMPIGFEFQVNAATQGDQSRPSVAVDADGQALVTWQGDVGAGKRGVFARRVFESMPIGFEFQVNRSTAGARESVDVAVDPERDYLVAWQSDEGKPGQALIFERRKVLAEIFSDGFESGDTSRWSSATWNRRAADLE